ncbi:MAG: hypothetical protein L0216_06975 [Planctomycetales bacterium]|nr:hypothetical protein [Planctomycetales bacterium]
MLLSELADFTIRIYEPLRIEKVRAPAALRRLPPGLYSALLFDDPAEVERLRDRESVRLMRLILSERATPHGKKEFKQVLVHDDRVVTEEKWDAFWTAAYRGMRESPDFATDERGRYFLRPPPSPS